MRTTLTLEDDAMALAVVLLGGDGIVSVVSNEAPAMMSMMINAALQSEIAKARELQPNKPLTHVVNSHHHFDHSGGLRAAVSEGLTIITQSGAAPFYKEAVTRAHTIAPDALAKNPKPLKLETVDDEMVLKDNTMTVNLFHISGSPHADTLLMAYFPKERILVEADVFNPGAAVTPFAPNLMENIKKRNLKIDRIVPLHATIAPYSDLVKAVAGKSTN